MTIIPYVPYEPPEPPRLGWKVTKEMVAERGQYNWCICTRCHTVTCYRVPTMLPDKNGRKAHTDIKSAGKWIDANVRCPRCKAFARQLTGASPALVDKAIANAKRERYEYFKKKQQEREGTPDA